MDDLEHVNSKGFLSKFKRNRPVEIHVPPSDVYHALDPNSLEFRLMELLPSQDFESTIECRLFHHDLRRKPEYEALSYVWGNPDFDKLILLNSQVFHITASLEIALRYLRSRSESRILWVDAVCINQNDEEERSSQVRLMRDIYQECNHDLVWLGPYPGNVYGLESASKAFERGLRVMEAIQQFDVTTVPDIIDDQELWGEVILSTRDEMNKNPNLVSVATYRNGWALDGNDVRSLSLVLHDSEVWSRVWIMQELSLAPEIVLVGGHSTLRWQAVSNFLGNTQYADAFHGPFGHHIVKIMARLFEHVQIIEHQRKILRNTASGFTSTLLDVLARFRYTRATDPRDKIYAVLGLVAEPHTIGVDYSKTTCEVFQDATIQLINNTSTLDILCQSPWTDVRNSRIQELPSWVADFTGPAANISLFAQRSIFCAGDTACEVPCQVDNGALRVTGACVGRIGSKLGEARLCQKNARSYDRSDLPRVWMQTHFGSQLLGDDNGTYCTGEPRLQAYWRTLVADCRCYPIRRLRENQGEIEGQGAVFEAVLRGEEHHYRLNDLDCWSMAKRMLPHWTFTTSDTGLYLLVTEHLEQGDVIAVLSGAKVPVVLMPIEGSTGDTYARYEFIGTAYVHGLMDGEAKSWAEEGRIEMQDFYLV
jgi:hypothetical protein